VSSNGFWSTCADLARRLNPTWDEKMLFHVRQYEDTFSIQFALLDWDKVSGNDFIGSSTIPLSELVEDAPRPDEKTGLYGAKEDGKHEMKEFKVGSEVALFRRVLMILW
jgi:Ca2+-dependent lipid-binding protein